MARYLAAALVVLASGGTKALEPGRFNHYYDAMRGDQV